MREGVSGLRVLGRDAVKGMAMAAMFLNHFAYIFFDERTLTAEILTDTGYFTAITMCWFLAEGYENTRSKKKYALRLLAFAVISQIPYRLAFNDNNLNVIATLFICFLILAAMDKIDNTPLRAAAVLLLTLATCFCDWALFAPLFTVMFADSLHSRRRTACAYLLAAVIFAASNTISRPFAPNGPAAVNWFFGAMSAVPMLISGFVILFMYDSERPHGSRFSKWFFYIFYPAHLMLLRAVHSLLFG